MIHDLLSQSVCVNYDLPLTSLLRTLFAIRNLFKFTLRLILPRLIEHDCDLSSKEFI